MALFPIEVRKRRFLPLAETLISWASGLLLYPSKLRRPIMDLFAGKKTAVYLGNENAGDPEVEMR